MDSSELAQTEDEQDNSETKIEENAVAPVLTQFRKTSISSHSLVRKPSVTFVILDVRLTTKAIIGTRAPPTAPTVPVQAPPPMPRRPSLIQRTASFLLRSQPKSDQSKEQPKSPTERLSRSDSLSRKNSFSSLRFWAKKKDLTEPEIEPPSPQLGSRSAPPVRRTYYGPPSRKPSDSDSDVSISARDSFTEVSDDEKKNKRVRKSSTATRNLAMLRNSREVDVDAGNRKHIVNEIVTTERNYVQILDLVLRIFVRPLKDSKIVSESVVDTIFFKFETLYEHHKFLLQALEEQVLEWDNSETCVGDLFLREMDFIVQYADYVNNYSNATNNLIECMKKPEFSSFIQKCESNPECKYSDVESFLVAPVQRPPRYELLLKELLKNTNYHHNDYDNLVKCLQRIEGSVRYINQQQKNFENINKLMKRLVGGSNSLVELSKRRYLDEGKIELRTNGKSKPRYLVLFNSLLLLCKEKIKDEKTVLQVIESIALEDNVSFFETTGMNGFKIILDKVVYECIVEQSELERWEDALSQALRVTSNSLQPIVLRRRKSGNTYSPVVVNKAHH